MSILDVCQYCCNSIHAGTYHVAKENNKGCYIITTSYVSSSVDHPTHYNRIPVECIDVVEHLSFNVGNAIKYLWRADHKGRFEEDMNKAIWYIQREIKRKGGVNESSI